MARDIGYGVQTILQIIEFDELQHDGERQQLLGGFHRGHMLRLAIAATELLGRYAESRIDHHYTKLEKQRQGGQA